MTNQLIQTSITRINGEQQSAINARELHAFLESKQQFADWINTRIQTYGFTESIDFIKLRNCVGMPSFDNPQRKKEYSLSLDMAKELCMLERNPKGREARRYFIEMERAAKTNLINQQALIEALCAAQPEITQLKRYVELGLSTAEIGKILSLSADAVRRRLHKYTKLGLLDWQPKLNFGKPRPSISSEAQKRYANQAKNTQMTLELDPTSFDFKTDENGMVIL